MAASKYSKIPLSPIKRPENKKRFPLLEILLDLKCLMFTPDPGIKELFLSDVNLD